MREGNVSARANGARRAPKKKKTISNLPARRIILNKQRQDVLKSIPLLLSYNLVTDVGIKTTFPFDLWCFVFTLLSPVSRSIRSPPARSRRWIVAGICTRDFRRYQPVNTEGFSRPLAYTRSKGCRVSPPIDAYWMNNLEALITLKQNLILTFNFSTQMLQRVSCAPYHYLF